MTTITDEGARRLIDAIVKQSASDYRMARKNEKKDELLLKEIEELEEKVEDLKAERLNSEGRMLRMTPEEKKMRELLNIKRCRYNYHKKLLSESTSFFESPWFYQMGGTEGMFEKLKSDCDNGIYTKTEWN